MMSPGRRYDQHEPTANRLRTCVRTGSGTSTKSNSRCEVHGQEARELVSRADPCVLQQIGGVVLAPARLGRCLRCGSWNRVPLSNTVAPGERSRASFAYRWISRAARRGRRAGRRRRSPSDLTRSRISPRASSSSSPRTEAPRATRNSSTRGHGLFGLPWRGSHSAPDRVSEALPRGGAPRGSGARSRPGSSRPFQ